MITSESELLKECEFLLETRDNISKKRHLNELHIIIDMLENIDTDAWRRFGILKKTKQSLRLPYIQPIKNPFSNILWFFVGSYMILVTKYIIYF